MYKFCRIPKHYHDEVEVMVRFCLDRYRDLDDYTRFTINEICRDCGYSTKSRNVNNNFQSKIREVLLRLEKDNLIIPFNSNTPLYLAHVTDHLKYKLSDDFSPSDNYIFLPSNVFDTIMHIKWGISKTIPLRLYLYMRSFIYDNNDKKPYGYFQNLDMAVIETGISRKRIDKCLEIFIQNHFFVKVVTGSYKKFNGKIANVPNLYLLPDSQLDENREALLQMLKDKYEVQEFMPLTSNGNKIRKD